MGLSRVWYQINKHETRNILIPISQMSHFGRPIKALSCFHCYQNGTQCPILIIDQQHKHEISAIKSKLIYTPEI